jgi:hypothetical protein
MEALQAQGAAEHAAEIAEQYHRSASLTGAERGVVHALVAVDRAAASLWQQCPCESAKRIATTEGEQAEI